MTTYNRIIIALILSATTVFVLLTNLIAFAILLQRPETLQVSWSEIAKWICL